MAQGIQQYYEEIQKHGFSRDNLFRITNIGGPLLDPLYQEYLTEGGHAYLTSSTVPGRTISNQTAPFMGLDFNVPGTAKYNNSSGWQVSFRTPGDFLVRNALEQMNYGIFDDGTSTGEWGVPCIDNFITISLLNIRGDIVRTYTLRGVYPVSIGDISYDVTGEGAIVTFDATLAYQFYRISGSPNEGSGYLGGTGAAGESGSNMFGTGNAGQQC
jgi:hypothetical protein